MANRPGIIELSVRFPVDLHESLGSVARDSCRTFNGEVIFRLQQSLMGEDAAVKRRSRPAKADARATAA